ncbi:MAG: GrpB family protein [Synoicihabitans sp.]
MKIEVIPYRSEWEEAFGLEKNAILALGISGIVQIHHIGSTSVMGLAAKPIIDIMLETESLEALDQNKARFASLNYEVMGEFGIAGRRYFRKGGMYRTHQIHAFKSGDANLLRHLAFRDYLREHPEVRREYGDLKIQVASQCNHDIDRYCEGKADFITFHEAKALGWREQKSEQALDGDELRKSTL